MGGDGLWPRCANCTAGEGKAAMTLRVMVRDPEAPMTVVKGEMAYYEIHTSSNVTYDLLVEQIEFADIVVLNKVADAEPHLVDAARKIIRSLNADARIIETTHSDVPPAAILEETVYVARVHTRTKGVRSLPMSGPIRRCTTACPRPYLLS